MFTSALLAVVLAPWTPIQTEGTKVDVWGRSYDFASNALPVSVTSQGREFLTGPMRLVGLDATNAPLVWTKGGSWVQESSDEEVVLCAWQSASAAAADASVRIASDGMVKVSLALVPGPAKNRGTLNSLWLEIPLKNDVAKLFNYSPASWTKLQNVGGVTNDIAWPFRPVVWLGDEKVGFCWFCESAEAFVSADENRVVEILPKGNETLLRIRLADGAFELPHTWVFGFETTPVKPVTRNLATARTLHSPQMGVGITIKRPEVWWTSQRAFPDGRIDEHLDEAKAAGVQTIAFHEDWIPVQNNPTPQKAFKSIVEKCHARGMKVLVYQGFEMSSLDPHWGDMSADCLSHDTTGRPVSYWYREPGQRDYRVCYASAFGDVWLARAKKAYEELNLDGFYLDGTIMPRACANERHGCGWRDAKGKLHETYPIFAVRRMMQELYAFVHARGGRIDAHQSGYLCPATLAFADTYWDGEQIACAKIDIQKELTLEQFRAEFMGRNHGLGCEFLAYEIPGKWTYDNALAVTLLHDVMVRPCGFVSVPRLAPVWKTLDDFGLEDAEFLPYWENGIKSSPESVKVSAYRKKGGRTLYVVSNLSPTEKVTADVTLLDGTRRSVILAPYSYQLVQ